MGNFPPFLVSRLDGGGLMVWLLVTVQDGGRQLQEAMQQNKTLTHMDLRHSECGHEVEYGVNQVLVSNRQRRRGQDICATTNDIGRTHGTKLG